MVTIPPSPNGATHHLSKGDIPIGKVSGGTETSQYPEEKKTLPE